jgi:hypothetical protein
VRDVARSRDFYAEIFGGRIVLEENPAIVKVANSWIIMNPGGGPTPDKPDTTLTAPEPGGPISSFSFQGILDQKTCASLVQSTNDVTDFEQPSHQRLR